MTFTPLPFAALIVRSVWFIVPSPGRDTIITGRLRALIKSRKRYFFYRGAIIPPAPSTIVISYFFER